MSYQSGYGLQSLGLDLKPTPMVKRLLIANAVIFAFQLILPAVMLDWFAFQPSQVVFKPWGPPHVHVPARQPDASGREHACPLLLWSPT